MTETRIVSTAGCVTYIYHHDPSLGDVSVLLDIELANLRRGNTPDDQIRRTQAVTLKEKFLGTLRRYQTSESEARRKYQARMERQYKIGEFCTLQTVITNCQDDPLLTLQLYSSRLSSIVRPEATQEEVAQALESDNQQVFAQSVC